MALIYSSDGKLVSPDGGNTWMTPDQASSRGYSVQAPSAPTSYSSSGSSVPSQSGSPAGFTTQYFLSKDGRAVTYANNASDAQTFVSRGLQQVPASEWNRYLQLGSNYTPASQTGAINLSTGQQTSSPSTTLKPQGGPSTASQTPSGLVQVSKNGSTMTVDPSNLSTWLNAGWSQVGGSQTSSSTQGSQQGGNVTLQSPSGQMVSVSQSDPMYQQYIQSGFTQPQTQNQPSSTPTAQTQDTSTGAAPWDVNQARQNLIAKYGADVVSQMDDNQIKYLGTALQATTLMNQNDAKTNLSDMTTQSLEALLTSAAAYIDPRYQDQWNAYKADTAQSFAQLTGDTAYLEQTQNQQFQQQKEQLSGQLAEAGLAQSGIRKKAEEQLATQKEGVISSSRRQLQQQMYQLGSQAEKSYGQAGADLAKPVSYMGQQVGYSPIGVKYGSATEQRNAEIQNMAQQIANQPQLNVPAAPTIK